jgi:hypothetical protein
MAQSPVARGSIPLPRLMSDLAFSGDACGPSGTAVYDGFSKTRGYRQCRSGSCPMPVPAIHPHRLRHRDLVVSSCPPLSRNRFFTAPDHRQPFARQDQFRPNHDAGLEAVEVQQTQTAVRRGRISGSRPAHQGRWDRVEGGCDPCGSSPRLGYGGGIRFHTRRFSTKFPSNIHLKLRIRLPSEITNLRRSSPAACFPLSDART